MAQLLGNGAMEVGAIITATAPVLAVAVAVAVPLSIGPRIATKALNFFNRLTR